MENHKHRIPSNTDIKRLKKLSLSDDGLNILDTESCHLSNVSSRNSLVIDESHAEFNKSSVKYSEHQYPGMVCTPTPWRCMAAMGSRYTSSNGIGVFKVLVEILLLVLVVVDAIRVYTS